MVNIDRIWWETREIIKSKSVKNKETQTVWRHLTQTKKDQSSWSTSIEFDGKRGVGGVGGFGGFGVGGVGGVGVGGVGGNRWFRRRMSGNWITSSNMKRVNCRCRGAHTRGWQVGRFSRRRRQVLSFFGFRRFSFFFLLFFLFFFGFYHFF